jgi:hypothetical protein
MFNKPHVGVDEIFGYIYIYIYTHKHTNIHTERGIERERDDANIFIFTRFVRERARDG